MSIIDKSILINQFSFVSMISDVKTNFTLDVNVSKYVDILYEYVIISGEGCPA